MGKYYIPKHTVVLAQQLRWDTWSEVCDLIGPDNMGDDRIRGVALTETGIVRDTPDDEAHMIGLWIPASPSAVIASENDYIIRDISGKIAMMKQSLFERIYQEAKDD